MLTATWNHKRVVYKWWSSEYMEEVVCDCGVKKYIYKSLIRGWVNNCWCLWRNKLRDKQMKHNKSRTRFYQIWSDIKQRCYNKKHKAYSLYWWRWIRVCDEWLEWFENFERDMFYSYNEYAKIHWEKDTTIDRINVDWDYCKDNCRWSTRMIQANNMHRTIKYLWKWKMMTPREIYDLELPSITRNCFKWRIRRRWDAHRALYENKHNARWNKKSLNFDEKPNENENQ